MAFKRPTLAELIERIDADQLSRLSPDQAALSSRLTRLMANGNAGLVHGLYGYLQWLERQLFPETCDDENLVLHSAGVPRRQPGVASGRVAMNGAEGALVNAGTRLQKDGQEYEIEESAVISGGAATVEVVAVAAGVAGDQPAGTELRLVSPVPGVSSVGVVDDDGLSGGANLETFESWRDRIIQRRARVPRGGAEGDWADWALEVPGVTRAWEEPLGMGLGTIVVRIMADDASDGPLPSNQLLEAVFEHIEARRNVQANVFVVAPATEEFKPELWVDPDTAENRAAVEASLRDLVEREGRPGGELLISRIRYAIGSVGGLSDYALESPTQNVTYSPGTLPVWGGVVWPTQ